MKLRRVNPSHLYRRRKPHAVITPSDSQRSHRSGVRSHPLLSQATLGPSRPRGPRYNNPRYNRIKGVDEVEPRTRRDAVEDREVTLVLHSIPSHVGNLLTGRQAAHRARHDVEPAPLAEFLARREQELVAETDAEERPPAVERAPKRRDEAQTVQVRHRVVKRAVARKDHRLRVVDGARILRDQGGASDPSKRLLDGAEIAPSIIDNCDHRLALPPAAARTATITRCPLSRARRRRSAD